ncbi:MAG: phosphate signaling complex protein PhoU [Verrucomicrobiota bacterium]|nr:phosphate signaling complex protein PhoU [Verrucomicrobiota bacterium]
MERTFENDLSQIKEAILTMASLVEKNFKVAIRALVERDESLIDEVMRGEEEIDQYDVKINDMAILYIARQAPVASDLRFITTVMKVSSDLERVGDQAVNICKRTRELNKEPLLKPLIDIPRLAHMSLEMLRDAMDAFVNNKMYLVSEITTRDKDVNELKNQLYRELTSYMIENPKTITRALNLMSTSRHLERVADHAKNIAKKVYFMYEGKDISHQDPPVVSKY